MDVGLTFICSICFLGMACGLIALCGAPTKNISHLQIRAMLWFAMLLIQHSLNLQQRCRQAISGEDSFHDGAPGMTTVPNGNLAIEDTETTGMLHVKLPLLPIEDFWREVQENMQQHEQVAPCNLQSGDTAPDPMLASEVQDSGTVPDSPGACSSGDAPYQLKAPKDAQEGSHEVTTCEVHQRCSASTIGLQACFPQILAGGKRLYGADDTTCGVSQTVQVPWQASSSS